jgi:serpin B
MSRIPSLTLAALLLCGVLASCGVITQPDTPPRTLTTTEARIAAANTDFAIAMLKQNARFEQGQNSFISPFSYMQALAMTSNGALGATKDSMFRALQLAGLAQADVNAGMKSLTEYVLGLDRKIEISTANGIWYNQQYTVEQPFLSTVKNDFGAEIRGMNFGRDAVKDDINRWVESKTNNRIKDLIKQDFTADDLMCLVNAVYFNAEWKARFDAARTKDDQFRTESGGTLPIKMMSLEKATDVRTSSLQGATVTEIPYSNGQFTMTVILPNTGNKLADVVAALTPNTWKQATDKLASASMRIEMPKFSMETRYEERASKQRELHALGMGIAFTPRADFSGMVKPPLQASISFVIHQTFLQVDERGTEAAAATGVGIGLTSAPPPPSVLRLDRPFAFMIREKSTGAIFFAGTLYTPVAK